MLCSAELREVTEPEGRDHIRLYDCCLLIHSIGSERSPYHRARETTALGLPHELCDSLGNFIRVRGVDRLESCRKGLEHGGRDFANCVIGCDPGGFSRLLNVCVKCSRVRAWLDEHDFDAMLRNFVTKTVT